MRSLISSKPSLFSRQFTKSTWECLGNFFSNATKKVCPKVSMASFSISSLIKFTSSANLYNFWDPWMVTGVGFPLTGQSSARLVRTSALLFFDPGRYKILKFSSDSSFAYCACLRFKISLEAKLVKFKWSVMTSKDWVKFTTCELN